MHARRHLARQGALRLAGLGFRGGGGIEPLDGRAVEQREGAEHLTDVAIVGVDPELIKAIWRRPIGVEVDRAALTLSELRPGGSGQQRESQRMRFRAPRATNELDS